MTEKTTEEIVADLVLAIKGVTVSHNNSNSAHSALFDSKENAIQLIYNEENIDDDGIYLKKPTPNIILTTDKISAITDETITFTATLKENNEPIIGETVIFADGVNTLGTSTTNTNGIATLTYSWDSIGNYNIKAIIDNIESNSVSIEIKASLLTFTITGESFTPDSSSHGLTGSNMIIDWGDGITESITSTLPSHTYLTNETHVVEVNGTVTSIQRECFKNCNNLISVNIPSSVTYMGVHCFRYCSNLTNILIQNGVTTIGAYSFSSCSGLTNIIIPDSVTEIGSYCFERCTGLTNIIIPNGVTTIEQFCFTRCSNLRSITIPDTVTTLGTSCFYACNSLIDCQLYWESNPIAYSKMPNNANTIFTIPYGTTSIYENAGYPSAQLVERSE